MAIVEDVGDEEAVAIDRHEGPVTTNDLLTTLQSLAKRLALPEDLFSTYLSDEKRELVCLATVRPKLIELQL